MSPAQPAHSIAMREQLGAVGGSRRFRRKESRLRLRCPGCKLFGNNLVAHKTLVFSPFFHRALRIWYSGVVATGDQFVHKNVYSGLMQWTVWTLDKMCSSYCASSFLQASHSLFIYFFFSLSLSPPCAPYTCRLTFLEPKWA